MVSRWRPIPMTGKTWPLVALFIGAAAMLGHTGTAAGADLGSLRPVVPAQQWRLTFTPYGWLLWLRGSQTVKAGASRSMSIRFKS